MGCLLVFNSVTFTPPRRPLTGPTPPKFDPRMKKKNHSPQTVSAPADKNVSIDRHRRSHRPHPMCKEDEHQRLKTSVMMLDSPHTSAPMLMRGNTPLTALSLPHRSRPTGYPPNGQPNDDDDDVFYLLLQKQKIGAKLHIYL